MRSGPEAQPFSPRIAARWQGGGMLRTIRTVAPVVATLFAGALLAGTPALPAAAQTRAGARTAAAISPRVAAEFKASDTNGDGVLTRAEVQARVARMDAGRARLTPAKAQMLASAWFGSADANRDGKVTPAEMQGLLVAMARRYDSNGDGVVSVSERQAARAATLKEMESVGPPRRSGGR